MKYSDIQINIDLDNIEVGINNWKNARDKIQLGFDLGIEELATRLQGKVLERLNAHGLGSTALATSIYVEEMYGGIYVNVNDEYAMYVEFGTGIVGSEHPHPMPWAYDINNHGEEGWKYIGKDGKLHWTAGQESKPFMYESWLWAKRSGNSIIMKNIRNQFR
jgi:hypothetical protein